MGTFCALGDSTEVSSLSCGTYESFTELFSDFDPLALPPDSFWLLLLKAEIFKDFPLGLRMKGTPILKQDLHFSEIKLSFWPTGIFVTECLNLFAVVQEELEGHVL